MEKSGRKRALIGILLVLIGTLFLLDNLGFTMDIPWYIFQWPMILILIGIVNLLTGNARAALIILGIGVAFYLDVLGIISIGELWPVFLIIIGLSFLLRKGRIFQPSEGNEDHIDEIAIFGGTDKTLISENFLGGKITCLFGGSKIDLRKSKISDTASIELFCMFGGAEILVPNHWKVNMKATAILGGLSDERKNVEENTREILTIKGFVMFGAGELKN